MGGKNEGQDGSAVDGPLPVDAIFDVLARPSRRHVVAVLAELPEPTVTVDELAVRLVQRLDGREGDAPSLDRVRVHLHHVHVPKLVAAGVVDYDAPTGTLRYTGDDRLEAWLRRARNEAAD